MIGGPQMWTASMWVASMWVKLGSTPTFQPIWAIHANQIVGIDGNRT